ncbi:MAG: DUF362 domain-containing protein [Pseudomonadota bacterium]
MKHPLSEPGRILAGLDGAAAPMSRRAFLKVQLSAAVATTIGFSGLWIPGKKAYAGVPDVAVAVGDIAPAVRKAVDMLGGMGSFVRPGQKVVIKPNMSFAFKPGTATNTSPLVVRELVALCKEAGAGRVRVLDHPLRREELCIEGVKKACDVFNEDIVYGVTRDRLFKPTPIPGGKAMRETDVMREVLEADVLIAAPVAKAHGATGVSLSMKGMMGLIWDRGIMHWRYDLATSIVDLASLVKPHLVVVDAIEALTTNGPSGPGKVVRYDTIIASRDMVAADAQAVATVQWYGAAMKARQVEHIRLAHERGLGRMDVENLVVRQERV